jgi:peptide/nickel transport system ATP-binding protein
MITEAILSFIGAGTPPNIPSWGNIMAEARSLFQIAGYLLLFPGICLSITVLAVNMLGDGMRTRSTRVLRGGCDGRDRSPGRDSRRLDPATGPATAADASARHEAPLLEVDGLKTHFFTRDGVVRAVDGVSFSVFPNETVAVVGESGCGKSVMSLSIMRLIASPPGRIVDGRLMFAGRDLRSLSEAEMRAVRGNEIAMIFQEPMTSLNPVLTIGRQIAETLRLHRGMSRAQALERAVEMLKLVNMPEPERRVTQYPHQISGGMRQRVMIAMALACDPRLVIADEPTTALDVTIQAQILDLMRRLKEKTGSAIVLITHDLGVVAEMAQRVVVMYAGRKVEEAPVARLFAQPRHPYTQGC